MSRKPEPPSRAGTVVVIIIIVVVTIITLSIIDVEPFYSFRTSMRKWVQNLPATVQQAFTQMTSPASQSSATPTAETATANTQTIGNWSYTLNSISWSGSTVTVGITIQNTGANTYPFGFGYQVSDQSFNSIYKLCAVDSNHLVFWDTSVNASGIGFYSRSFGPGETESGTLIFTVDSDSQNVYLTIANGGNPANKLFYLGNPQ